MKRRLVSAFLALSLVSAMFPAAAAGGSGGVAAAPVQVSPPVQAAPPVQVSPPTQTNTTPPQDNTNSSGQTKPVTNPPSQANTTNNNANSSAQTNPSTGTDSSAQSAPQTLQQVNGVYQIGTAADLLAFAKLVSGGAANANATLVNDITLTGTWVPIGTTTKPYVGTFNGASRIITGLNGYLFGALGAGGKIENVLLSGTGGSICLIKNGQIINCTNNILPDSNAANPTTPAGNTSAGSNTATPSTGTNTNPPAGTTNTSTPPAGTTTTPTVTTPATAKKATVSPANASVKLGEAVTVNVSNAIPNSTILVKGPVSKTTDVGADGTTYFTIDTKTNSDKFTPSSGNSETFRFALETNGVEIGSYALTVTNPEAPAAQPETKPESVPQNTQTAPTLVKPSSESSASAAPEPKADHNQETDLNQSSNTTNNNVDLLADEKTDLNNAVIKLSQNGSACKIENGRYVYVYDGDAVPTVSLSMNNKPIDDTYYTVTFKNHTSITNDAEVHISCSDAANNPYTGATSDYFKIVPRPVTITSVSAEDRTYKADYTEIKIKTVTLDGVRSRSGMPDVVSVDTSSLYGTISSADVGDYNTLSGFSIPYENFTLTGKDKSFYELAEPSTAPTITPAVKINPIEVSIVRATVADKKYDGTDDATVEVVFNTSDIGPGDYEIWDAKFDDANVGQGKPVTGKVHIKAEKNNCSFANGAKESDLPTDTKGNITQASIVPGLSSAPEKTYDSSDELILTPRNIVLDPNTLNAENVIEEAKVVFDDANAGENKGYALKVKLKSGIGNNFSVDTDADGFIKNIRGTNGKITPAELTNISWSTLTGTDAELTYGQTLGSLLSPNTGTAQGIGTENVPGTFVWEKGDELPDATPNTGSTFKLTFVPTNAADKTNYNAPAPRDYTVVVHKADPKFDPPVPAAVTVPFGKELSSITENTKVVNPYKEDLAVKGKFTWPEVGNSPVSSTSYEWQFDLDTSELKNYNQPAPGSATVTWGKVKPTITITPKDGSSCLPGTPLQVEVTIENLHNKGIQPQPVLNSVTYKIGNDEEKTLTSNGQIPFKAQIPISKDLDNNTQIIIKATANEDTYYLEETATSTVKVTNRDAVTINAAAKGKVYDGESCLGYENLTITDVNGSPVSAVTTTCVYKTKDGVQLDGAPIDAGDYIVEISIDTEKFVTREPITREFTITPKQLYWTSTGSRSAHKEIGATGEATVNGTLGIGGLYERDKDRVKFTQPEMRSMNFSQCTTEGRYDILVVPATGTWADCFQLTAPYNYTLPIGNPTAVGTVGNVDASTSNELTITPATDSQGNKLKLEYTPNQVSVPESLRTNAALDTPAEIMTVMKNAVMGKNSAIINEDVFVCDVKLMVQKDGNWVEATKGNFPDGGITVTIPFPNSRAQNATYFTAAHMFTNKDFGHDPGYIEFPKASKTTTGIQFTLTGLSPVSIGWSDKQGSENNNSSDNNNNNNSNNDNNNNNNSSSEETYRVRILSTRHGRVGTSHTRAEAGETVTLTIRPDSGYRLDDLIVTDNRDRDIRVRSRSNNRYTFTMPSRPVTVDVSFTDGSTSSGSSNTSSGTLTPATLPVWSANYSYLNCDGMTNCPSRRFPDLNTAMWYHIPLDFNINSGLMGAMGDGRFGPSETLTRAMLVQILYNHAGKPSVVASGTFRDVDRGAWYENAVNWASMQGIASGTGNNAFSPNAPITREQLAVMLYNYATRRGLTLTNGAASGFTDSWNISSWAQNAVSAMQRANIIAGKAGGNFDPKGQATRAETAQMLYNLLR